MGNEPQRPKGYIICSNPFATVPVATTQATHKRTRTTSPFTVTD